MSQVDDGDNTRRLSIETSSTPEETSRRCTDEGLQDPLDSSSSLEQQEQQQQVQDWPGWAQDDDMVVIQDWDDSSLACYKPQPSAIPEDAEEDADQPSNNTEAPQLSEGWCLTEFSEY